MLVACAEGHERQVEIGADNGHKCTLKNLGFIHHTYTELNNGGSTGKKTVCKVIPKNIRDCKKYSTVIWAQCNYILPLLSQCSTDNSHNLIQPHFLIKGGCVS